MAVTVYLASRIDETIYTASAAGAVNIENSTVVILGGSATALTLGTPTTAQNGTTIRFVAGTAQAHTVTAGTIGFNAADAAGDVATFGGAIGDHLEVMAYAGEWLVVGNLNVTFG